MAARPPSRVGLLCAAMVAMPAPLGEDAGCSAPLGALLLSTAVTRDASSDVMLNRGMGVLKKPGQRLERRQQQGGDLCGACGKVKLLVGRAMLSNEL